MTNIYIPNELERRLGGCEIESRVLITTIWEGQTVPIVIYKLMPGKVILITDDSAQRKKAVAEVKAKFPHIAFDAIKVHEFEVPEITKKMVSAIKAEEKDSEIFLHLSEGRKTMFLAGVFAASLLRSRVSGTYYLREDNNELMQVPLMEFRLSANKRKILNELESGNRKAEEIRKKLKVNRSLVYAAIKDMIKEGLIDEKWELTDAGKIVVM